jgi:hypothetical protein
VVRTLDEPQWFKSRQEPAPIVSAALNQCNSAPPSMARASIIIVTPSRFAEQRRGGHPQCGQSVFRQSDQLNCSARSLAARGAQLRIVGAHGWVRDLLRADGLGKKVGGLGRVTTLDHLLGERQAG